MVVYGQKNPLCISIGSEDLKFTDVYKLRLICKMDGLQTNEKNELKTQ